MDIQSLVNLIPEELAERETKKRKLQALFEEHKQELVIYGHGNLGPELEKGLDIAGWPIQYYLDAYKPTDLKQKNINLKDARHYLTPNALIIVAVYDVVSAYPFIRSEIEKEGFHNIVSILDLRIWPELFQSGNIHSVVGWDIESISWDQASKAYELLADAMSQKVFYELLYFMLKNPYEKLSLCPARDQYMPSDVYLPIDSEFIIDCGAYDGDTMRAFYSRLGQWGSYTAIDADPYNIEKVRGSIQKDIPIHLQGVTKTIHAAVSNEPGTVSFVAKGCTSSHVSAKDKEDRQTVSVPVVRLDDVIQGPVTLLKMDIEGFELRALQGAERLIRENQPLLAICGYHHQEDLWEIPLYMKKLLPNHRIYLRNYVGMIEYVFYAVPQDRVLLE